MNDQKMTQCEAMMHLEMAVGLLSEIPMAHKPSDGADYLIETAARHQLDRRIWAALYLLQSMLGGSKPENFAKVVDQARWYDAREEAIEVIAQAKDGLRS